jgi:Tfp pilus assembly protein PilF
VRITAQLIEATTDQHLWAENYERSLTDILALQAEVARAIAGEIQVALTPQDERRLSAAPPVDPRSYEAFLLGQYFLRQETIEGARAALKHFEAGLAHDPDNALALAGTAEVNAYWGRMMGLGDEADRRAEDAAAKALAIDDTLAEAHLALSQVNFTQWKWEAARSELERAIEIKPGLAEAHHGYAHYFWSQGNADAAIIESLRFLELDPQWPRTHECFGFNLTMVGQADRAVGHLHRAIELDPSYYPGHNGLGDAYVQLGELEKAAAEYRTAQGLSADPFAIATLSLAYVAALSGNEAEARAILHELDAEGTEHSAFLVATVDAALGDTNRAFEQLELAYRNKEWWMTTIKIHPWLDPLRDDPRFEDMVRRMNFPEA